MKRRIHRIHVTLEPWTYNYPGAMYCYLELRFRVDSNGGVTEYTQMCDNDDLESRFDYMFESIKQAMKAEMRKEEAKK